MCDSREKEALIQSIREQLEALLLSDRLSEGEKLEIVKEALKIIECGSKAQELWQ